MKVVIMVNVVYFSSVVVVGKTEIYLSRRVTYIRNLL